VKHTWDKLGEELNILAKLHAEKGQAYQDCVRKPLIELLPQLEEKRKEVNEMFRVWLMGMCGSNMDGSEKDKSASLPEY